MGNDNNNIQFICHEYKRHQSDTQFTPKRKIHYRKCRRLVGRDEIGDCKDYRMSRKKHWACIYACRGTFASPSLWKSLPHKLSNNITWKLITSELGLLPDDWALKKGATTLSLSQHLCADFQKANPPLREYEINQTWHECLALQRRSCWCLDPLAHPPISTL